VVNKDCNTCNNIEDENHFFLHCRINNQPRNLLFNIIGNSCSNFDNMSDFNKLKYILNPNPDLSSVIFIFNVIASIAVFVDHVAGMQGCVQPD
jgi:hypothetical protein